MAVRTRDANEGLGPSRVGDVADMPAPDASREVCARRPCSADRMAAATPARHGVSMTGLPALMRELEARRGARLGSLVEVVDRAGRATRYELVGRAPGPSPVAVTPASPTGSALWGARPGDAVRVTLPNGRERRVRVTSVTPGEHVRPRIPGDDGGSPA